MIENIKERLSQLVEINRALAHDLDVSRRVAARLGRERDEMLRERNAVLRDAEAARSRALRAEDLAAALTGRLEEAERERDEFISKLEESTEAMDEIRSRLAGVRPEELAGEPL